MTKTTKKTKTLLPLTVSAVLLLYAEVQFTYLSYIQTDDQQALGAIVPGLLGIIVIPFYLYFLVTRWRMVKFVFPRAMYLLPFSAAVLIPLIAASVRDRV